MEWFARWGAMGPAAFALLDFFATMLPVPTAPLTLAAGALFGLAEGLAVVLCAQYAASLFAYWLGRRGLRGAIRRRMEAHPKIEAARRTLVHDGWKAVLLFQLSPALPFGMQNYFLGASGIPLRSFLAGTAIAMLPSSALFVFAGSSGRTALEGGGGKWALLALGAGATALLGWRLWKRRDQAREAA